MPQLAKAQADQAAKEAWDPNEAPPSQFEALEDGDYILQLISVTTSENKGASGYHYWIWVLEHPETKTRIWENTSLSPKGLGKLGQVFAAFGVPADSPTEAIIGDYVGATVSKVVQQQGKRKGEYTNKIEVFFPADEMDEYDPDVHGRQVTGGGRPASAEDFGGEDEPTPEPETKPKGGRRPKATVPPVPAEPSDEPF